MQVILAKISYIGSVFKSLVYAGFQFIQGLVYAGFQFIQGLVYAGF
jgi:hypothetical protein